MKDKIDAIQQEIKKVIIGKDEVIEKVLMAILSGGHVLLEDVPGTGKTTMAAAFAKVLGLDNKRIQFTSDTMPSDITGFSVYDMKTGELEYKQGAIMTNLLLADEINRTSSKTQSALLEAMEEKQVTVDGITRKLEEPFLVLATQNPVGSIGTQMLPTAQLDRFFMKLSMGYPDRESQIAIMKDRRHDNPLDSIKTIIEIPQLLEMMEETKNIFVSDPIYHYIADLIEATRKHPFVQLGISPRGGLALCKGAKACAKVAGRDYVIPEDVKHVLGAVCAHRLILSGKARLHEQGEEEILQEIAETIKQPQERESFIK